MAHVQQQQIEQAQRAFEQAAAIAPASADHQEWLGYIRYRKRENDAALIHLKRAQQSNPDSVFALTILGRIYQDQSHFGQACAYLQRARKLAPNNREVNALLCQALHQNRDFDAALELGEKLIESEPENYHHWNNLGNVYRDLASIPDASRCYQRASALNSDDPVPFSNWLTAMHYDPTAGRSAITQRALEWQSRFAPSHPPARPVPSDCRSDKRLRLGLLSDGFRQHPVGKMIIRCLENLGSADFELFAYTSNDARDALNGRIRALCQQWQPVQHLSQEQFAQRVRADCIDIFIDLSGHNAGSRMRAVAMQPAPLIVKWVGGLINTTGVEAIDYLISDAIETPPGEDAFYSEKLIRMPNDYIVFDPPTQPPAVGELPALKNGYITLGCFNNPCKLNDVVFAEWAAILHALPDSKLMLKGQSYKHQGYCDRVYASFEKQGIARERLILEGPADNHAMLEAYNRVDIALDPWPYSGGLTTCEGFLMGVPVVTLPGPTFAGRHSATHLVNAGMSELVVASWEAYRARVIELANDLDNLATIRRLLRDVLLRSPVCDGKAFARDFTTAMRAIWQRYCEGHDPVALRIEKSGEARFADQEQPEALKHPAPEPHDSFEWEFQGKIIAIDNGGRSIDYAPIPHLLEQNALELVVFDPASRLLQSALRENNALHYYPNVSLGDGRSRTLHVCVDADFSSTLPPIEASTAGAATEQNQTIIAKLPINTVALDSIEGLPHIDWIMLDDLNAAGSILEHAGAQLDDALIVQVRVALRPTHHEQPNLADLRLWSQAAGFELHRLRDIFTHQQSDRAYPSESKAAPYSAVEALFVPNASRLEKLDDNQRQKLAFILHTAFGVHELPYELIARTNAHAAERYLMSLSQRSAGDAHATDALPGILDIPDAPHMSPTERELFASVLDQANSYFEFGSGGSTVWAVEKNLTVHGVDSDERWIKALKTQLGSRCCLKRVDIGPVGVWGYPTSTELETNFCDYSRSIFEHTPPFDLILVDGRFRVACTITAIQHILQTPGAAQTSRIFIHDFWNRSDYRVVLQFLECTDRAETAGLFRLKPGLDGDTLAGVWQEYCQVPN